MEELQFILDNVDIYLLVFVRMSGIFLLNPLISRTNIPAMARVAVVLFTTVMVTPMITLPEGFESGTFDFLLCFLKEIFIGILLGYVFNIFYYMLLATGDIMDTNLGFGMAKVFDPGTSIQSSVVTNILHYMFVLYFFATDCHLTLIGVIVSSFDIAPIGQEIFAVDSAAAFMIDLFGSTFSLALKVAIPFIAADLLLEISLGILMKLIPQIHVFVINFQLKILLTLVLLFILAPSIGAFIDNYTLMIFDEMKNALSSLNG